MPADDAAKLPARRLFTFSLLYLFLLFAVILAERGLHRNRGMTSHDGRTAGRRPAPDRGATEAAPRTRAVATAIALGVLVVLFYV